VELNSSEERTQILPQRQFGRYRVLSLLGAGGMGEVYSAEDTRLNRPVALKLLPARFLTDADRVRRFEQEALSASALNHPNIVTVYDVGETQEGRFIAMEMIRGRTLRKLAENPLSLPQLTSIGKQAAEALAVAHAAGITHRDIKPENIMVRDDGYVKVLDFGLARLSNQIGLNPGVNTDPNVLVGTVRYMSPEQAQGKRVTQTTDLFSLGIVLYELATGRLPFTADTQLGFLHAIVVQPALPLTQFNPDIPARLDELILSMLEKNEHLRPSAADVAAALQETGSLGDWETGKSEPRLRAATPTRRSTVGREQERAALRAGFAQAEGGCGLMICVTGEPGIGKTTVVEDFLAELGSQRLRIARGRCSERLAGTEAYLPFWEALENMLRGESHGVVAQTMKRLAPTWYAQIAPNLNDSSAANLTKNKASSQERLKRELVALLQEIATRQPLLLFIDDLHWADASTVDLLAYMATQFEEMRILVVVTYRPSELLLGKHPFQQIKLDLQSRGVCRELPLDFLSRAEIERYLELLFPKHHFPAGFVQMIHTKTEGNPLFMTDLVRYLRDHQVMTEVDGSWELAQALPDIERELPESVRSMVERKIAQIGEEDRKLLAAMSVQGYEFDSAVIARALGVDPAEVEDRLDVLERVHSFVRLVEEREFPDGTLSLRYRFVHVLYQNALYANLRPTRRALLSGAVAQALLGCHGAERAGEVASRLAFLFEAARDFACATDYFLRAAQNAYSVFAYQEAEALAQRGLDLLKMLPEGPERDRRELGLQMVLGLALTPVKTQVSEEVMQAFRRARELCQKIGESPALLKAIYGLWTVHVIRADHQIADELADQLLRLAQQSGDPALLTRAHSVRAFSHDYMGNHLAAREHYEEALRLYDEKLERAIINYFGSDSRVITLSRLNWTLLVLGYPDQARKMLEKSLAACREIAHPFTACSAMLSLPQVYVELGEPQRALEIAEQALAIATDHGFPLNHAYASMHRGHARARLGQSKEGIAEIQENFVRLRAIGTEMSLNGYSVDLAEVMGLAGRIEEGLAIVTEAIIRAEKSGECYFEAESHRVKGDLLVQAKGQSVAAPSLSSEAEASYQLALEVARRRGALTHELRAAMGLSRLWRQQSKHAEAHELLAHVYERFTEGFDCPDLKSARALLDELS
jgi:predicted ATPase/predicted Ser/Thr protein kinase